MYRYLENIVGYYGVQVRSVVRSKAMSRTKRGKCIIDIGGLDPYSLSSER